MQSDLADTLQLIADEGPDAFYKGAIAEKIVAEMQAGGGLIDMASLAAYKPAVREAIRGEYRGYEIVAMPPPSSGGVMFCRCSTCCRISRSPRWAVAALTRFTCWPKSCDSPMQIAASTWVIRISTMCRRNGC